jgi:GrpB-like predicted nucleotidyltransferase (UPF0157 family)
MIGLKRGTIVLRDYCDEWPRLFELEKEKILSLTGSKILQIEHIGSTAIPGIKAKPLIDMLIKVKSFKDIEDMVPILETQGYTYFGYLEEEGDYFFAKGVEENRTHYLHAYLDGSDGFDACVIFRDALRKDNDLALKYQKIKEESFRLYPTDRNKYTANKHEFIVSVVKKYSN